MCLSDNTFVETMCARYGKIELIDYHNERMSCTRKDLWGQTSSIDLRNVVNPSDEEECLKVRVVYGRNGIEDVYYSPYTMKNIHTLRLVTDNDITYTYKSTDRTRLSALAAMKGSCDEVLIVKNGLITDTSYTNVAAYIDGKWLTPRTPLLKGTRRASLLDKGIVTEADIRATDITPETEIMLFNGMMDFGKVTAKIVF